MALALEYAHLADFVTQDQANKLIVVGIFSHINDNMRVRPIPWPGGVLVASLTASIADGSDHEIEVRLVDGNGQPVGPATRVPVRFVTNGAGYRMRAGLLLRLMPGAIHVPDVGDYDFEFWWGGTRLGTLSIVVQEPLPKPE